MDEIGMCLANADGTTYGSEVEENRFTVYDGAGNAYPVLDVSCDQNCWPLYAIETGNGCIWVSSRDYIPKSAGVLEKIYRKIEKEYTRAQNLAYVRNPLAYALFKVWREIDKKGVRHAADRD